MNTHVSILLAAMMVAAAAALSGCGAESTAPAESSFPELPPATIDIHHEHGSEGPHHGHLIELGRDDFHAELVHDEETETVTVYILDGAAAETVAIDAPELVINVRHDHGGEQFRLTAAPDAGDPQGRSSRFRSRDPELGHILHNEQAEARLVVKIDGTAYTGRIAHDHHGHDHSHGDHDHGHGDHGHGDGDHDHADEDHGHGDHDHGHGDHDHADEDHDHHGSGNHSRY